MTARSTAVLVDFRAPFTGEYNLHARPSFQLFAFIITNEPTPSQKKIMSVWWSGKWTLSKNSLRNTKTRFLQITCGFLYNRDQRGTSLRRPDSKGSVIPHAIPITAITMKSHVPPIFVCTLCNFCSISFSKHPLRDLHHLLHCETLERMSRHSSHPCSISLPPLHLPLSFEDRARKSFEIRSKGPEE